MLTVAKKRKLVKRLQHPVRLKELRGFVADLIKDASRQSVENLITMLKDEGVIQEYVLEALNGRKLTVFCSTPLSEIDVYELAASVLPDGYFCNLTAVYHHSLTNQIPNAVYWRHESLASRRQMGTIKISDGKMRSAFIKPHRQTHFVIKHNGHDILITAGAHGRDYGIEKVRRQHSPCPVGSHITCLERTLIDAVVSPHYSGGITSLCEYFRAAAGKLDVDRLLDIYQKMNFVYPYAQTLGFFMKYCGMQHQAEKIRSAYPPKQRFYVDHGAKTTWAYDEQWMLCYPKGLVNEN